MSVPAWTRRLLTLGILFAALPSLAAEWNGFTPGVSTGDDVLIALGDPSDVKRTDELLLYDYRANARLTGASRAVFQISRRNGKLFRIEVTPSIELTRAAIERVYGPSCTSSAGQQPCYETTKQNGETQLYFRSLGVQIGFDEPKNRATTVSYVSVSREGDSSAWAGDPSGALERRARESASGSTSEKAELGDLGPVTVGEGNTGEESTSVNGVPDFDLPGRADVEEGPPTKVAPVQGGGEDTSSAVGFLSAGGDRGLGGVFTLGGVYFQRVESTAYTKDLSGVERTLETMQFDVSPPAEVDGILNITPPGGTMRGYLLGRLLFDPFVEPPDNPLQAILDQLWLRWEAADWLYLTVGRQHMKWGQGSIFRPTDFLRKVNPTPLEKYDLRPGIDMFRVQIPVKPINQTLYGLAFVDTFGEGENRLRKGAAFRVEQAFTAGEFAASAVFVDQRKPRYGFDINFGLGPFDVYGEVAMLHDPDSQRWARQSDGSFAPVTYKPPQPSWWTFDSIGFPAFRASGGALTRLRAFDVFEVWLRAEGMYNQLGYDDHSTLTWINYTGDYEPLYFSKYYGLFQMNVTKRSSYEPQVSVAALANLVDRSGIVRFDFGFYPMLSSQLGAFLEIPFGRRGGELRFVPDPSVSIDPDVLTLDTSAIRLFRFGISGRLQF